MPDIHPAPPTRRAGEPKVLSSGPGTERLKIHLITNLFHPDELAGAALYTDFARYFKDAGHDVRVTAAFSYYPAWRRRSEDQGLRWTDENLDGIPVRRISMFVPGQPRGLTRLMSDASFLLSILRRGRFRDWVPDVVVTACPMLSQCIAQRFLYRGAAVKRVIIVQDFVVDAALELGILRLPGLGRALRHLETWALRSADVLTSISEEMCQKLRERVGPSHSVRYVPNWVHRELAGELARQGVDTVRRESRTLFYSGNLGVKQGLPDFMEDFNQVDAAWTLRIQGGGAEIEKIRGQLGGPRIALGVVEDVAAYVARLRECTACLVTQRAGVSANFLPSKLLPALATGTPVLAVAEAGTPLAREVSREGFGVVVEPGNRRALEAALQQLSDPVEAGVMSRRAVRRASFFRRDRVLGDFADLITNVAAAREA